MTSNDPNSRRGSRARTTHRLLGAALAAVLALSGCTPLGLDGIDSAPSPGFVSADGTRLTLNGTEFRFTGANSYYLGYSSTESVRAVLDDAHDAGLTVIRTWGFQDYQSSTGGGVAAQDFAGVWYQSWDESAQRPQVNEGVDGLERLDFVIAEAAARGLKLIVPFTNNWAAFGGMDQYVQWAGLHEHAAFFTDARIRSWFTFWISTVLTRTNSITGVVYKDDPTILAWELANEPSCTSSGVFDDGDCDSTTIIEWARSMSDQVKSIDTNHLLAVGDEGFFCREQEDWTLNQSFGVSGYGAGFGENCTGGVNTVALASLPNIDLMSMHLYPETWKTSIAWGTAWIQEHALAAQEINKPSYLGEFGLIDSTARVATYSTWLDQAATRGVAGAIVWMLAAEIDGADLYPDYDGFTVYCPSAVCDVVANR